jgi:ElaB/YqjD/DUF883 family membrane-anchored ribosome-binding protein
MAQATDQDIDALKKNFSTLKSDMSDLTSVVKDLIADETRVAKIKMKKAERQVEHKIEENPMASVGIAMGVGFIIGMVIDRQFRG